MPQTHDEQLRTAKMELALSITSLILGLSVIFSCAIWGIAWIVGQPIGEQPSGHLIPRVSVLDGDEGALNEHDEHRLDEFV